MDGPKKVGDFAARFGLRESVAGPEPAGRYPSSADSRTPDLDMVYKTLGRLVFAQLKKQPEPTTLFDIIDRLGMRIEEILPVIRRMEENRFVEVVERARNGNWQIVPTSEGQTLLE